MSSTVARRVRSYIIYANDTEEKGVLYAAREINGVCACLCRVYFGCLAPQTSRIGSGNWHERHNAVAALVRNAINHSMFMIVVIRQPVETVGRV